MKNSHPTITHLSKLLTESIHSITSIKSIRSCNQDEINSIKNHFFNSLHAQAITIIDSIVDEANDQHPESPLSDYLLDYKHLFLR